MPNGELQKHYGSRVLSAGKNPDKARFNFVEVKNFEFLENKSRVRVIYLDQNMKEEYKEKLGNIIKIYEGQK